MGQTINWDMTTWETSELVQWCYVIAERSDRLISQAMYDDDWREYEDDERTDRKIADIPKSGGLRADGKPLEKAGLAEREE